MGRVKRMWEQKNETEDYVCKHCKHCQLDLHLENVCKCKESENYGLEVGPYDSCDEWE